MNIIMTEGEKLLLERRRRNLPVWKLAAQANIDPTTYSCIEHDKRRATLDQRLALGRALNIEPELIFDMRRGA